MISGFDWARIEETDTGLLIRSLGAAPDATAVEACSPWRFAAPLSPDMAARREGREIDFEALVNFCREAQGGGGDLLLIEGIGGAMVPLDATHLVLDWIAALGAPALVVVGSYLGSLSHTLTTLAALQGRGIEIAAVVVDESQDAPVPLAETAATLARFLPGLALAQVPRGATPAETYGVLAGIIGL